MIELGELLGVGATSEVYAFGKDEVVKLGKSTNLPATIDHEAWVTRLVHENGVRAPAVRDVVEVDGRRGFVMQRVEGPTLLHLLLVGLGVLRPTRAAPGVRRAPAVTAVSPEACGRMLATLCHALHAIPCPEATPCPETTLVSFHDAARITLGYLEGRGIARELVYAGRELLATLPAGEAICHGDLHPMNVILTPEGTMVLDWASATRGHPFVDVARLVVILSISLVPPEIHPGVSVSSFWQVRRRILPTFLRTYAALSEQPVQELEGALAPWVRMMAILGLNDGTPEQQEVLVRYLRGGGA